MLKFPALPIALVALGLPFMASAAGEQSALDRQLSLMKGEPRAVLAPSMLKPKLFGRNALSAAAAITGTLTVGKVITYDGNNNTPYNQEPTDTTTFNMVVTGYFNFPPTTGSLSPNLAATTTQLAFTRVVKLFNPAPIPEADLLCNLFVTSSLDVQGVSLDGTYLPLSKVGSSVKNGTTYFDYLAVALDKNAPNYPQYFLDEHAFCTTFESFNSIYPNGASVPVTLVP
ncbi:hypothetical protein [Metapseudomonas otitidis]|uniref:hypothetical protein n=1 Tax=Metapseudomonas otitidis TaxID=319939 RepID=UPI000D1BC3CC|nr:hypothetical protein [Pseudomonas otitidis]